jgi:hypothetical protein
MSLVSYQQSLELSRVDYDFSALIMAAMRKADSHNLHALQLGFPRIWVELQMRYDAPGGYLEGEYVHDSDGSGTDIL